MNNKSHEAKQAIPLKQNPESVRQIDMAMADERPAKVAIRDLWLER